MGERTEERAKTIRKQAIHNKNTGWRPNGVGFPKESFGRQDGESVGKGYDNACGMAWERRLELSG